MSGGGMIVERANRIARFFAAYPEEEAVAGIADHLRKFWDPRMRAQLLAHLAAGGEGLHPLARAAAECLAEATRAPSSG